MPTLLDYLGIENPQAEQLPGRSFAGVLDGTGSIDDSHVVVFDEYGPVRMIRNKDWKYVHRFADGPSELYNLMNDPAEEHNLSGDGVYREVKDELHTHLTEWFSHYVTPECDGSSKPVTGSGQTGVCGSGAGGRRAFLPLKV